MSNEIVMIDSTEAAQYLTDIKGWVSRCGHYFGNGSNSEKMARYAGCTHVACVHCGRPALKGFAACPECRALAWIAQYESMPRAEWDGKAMIYSDARDRYYNSPDDAADDLEDGETMADLRLMICEPNYVRQIDQDFCYDELPEDGDIPDEVAAAIDEFNRAVSGIVLSWSPGKFALAVPEPEAAS